MNADELELLNFRAQERAGIQINHHASKYIREKAHATVGDGATVEDFARELMRLRASKEDAQHFLNAGEPATAPRVKPEQRLSDINKLENLKHVTKAPPPKTIFSEEEIKKMVGWSADRKLAEANQKFEKANG